jgi:plasmid stabilization system protein ParE
LRKYGFHPEARAELLAAARYYKAGVPLAARRFKSEVGRAIRFILAYPEASPAVGREGARRKLLSHFPYDLIYLLESDRIRVVAVAHQKRRPGYWTSRL